MQVVPVSLGQRSYDIIIDRGVLGRVGDSVRPFTAGRAMVITDDNVGPLYAPRVLESLAGAGIRAHLLTLPAGEPTKAFSTLPAIYERMVSFGLTRRDLVLTLGGGVIGDLGGFAAASFLRGVPFVQLPTTLLAQVDSSVGGKVAVDLPQGKNLVGAFYQPRAVLADPRALESLTDRFFADGLAEVVKTACIRDEALFDLLWECAQQGNPRLGVMERIEAIVARCCEIKGAVVEADEQDNGQRMLLNFGHTIGHAIEGAEHYTGHSHGEAVGIGMVAISRLAQARGQTPGGTAGRIARLLRAFGLPTRWEGDKQLLIPFLQRDKKNLGRGLTVVLLERIGRGVLYSTDASYFSPLLTGGLGEEDETACAGEAGKDGLH